MAKKVISISLDEKVIAEMDELSKKMGVSRSKFIEMTLKTAVGGQSLGGFYKWLFTKETEKEVSEGDLVIA